MYGLGVGTMVDMGTMVGMGTTTMVGMGRTMAGVIIPTGATTHFIGELG